MARIIRELTPSGKVPDPWVPTAMRFPSRNHSIFSTSLSASDTLALNDIGSPDDYVTTVRDVSDYVDIKKESLSCHRTQVDPNGPFGSMAPPVLTAWMSTEYFYLVQPTNGETHEDILLDLD